MGRCENKTRPQDLQSHQEWSGSPEERTTDNSQEKSTDGRLGEVLLKELSKFWEEVKNLMCRCGCQEESHGGHHRGYGFPLMSIEEEVKGLEEAKETLEERLANVNKRLEVLKR